MQIEDFKKNLEKLSKCKCLEPSDLEGRYKKSFTQLKQCTLKQANAILTRISIAQLKFTTEKPADDINTFAQSEEGTKITKECHDAVFEDCDFDRFMQAALKMREHVKEIAWKYADPSWDSIEMKEPDWEEEIRDIKED